LSKCRPFPLAVLFWRAAVTGIGVVMKLRVADEEKHIKVRSNPVQLTIGF
jgi:hypothetical protein